MLDRHRPAHEPPPVLTVHPWRDRERAFAEIRRVARRRAVFLTIEPDATPFWLTRDYLPEIHLLDAARVPPLSVFDELGGGRGAATADSARLLRRLPGPRSGAVRAPASTRPCKRTSRPSSRGRQKRDGRGLEVLRGDLDDRIWEANTRELADATSLDAGYRIVICTL